MWREAESGVARQDDIIGILQGCRTRGRCCAHCGQGLIASTGGSSSGGAKIAR